MSEMINKEIDVSMLKRLVEERSEISNYMITGTLKGIDASRLIFTNCCFQDCSIMGCFFEKTVFVNCSFYGCDITQVNFKGAVFKSCTFSSRFDMCDFSVVEFVHTNFRRGYIRYSTIDKTLFCNVTFDGTWAGALLIKSSVSFDHVNYTMGGATRSELEKNKQNFFAQFKISFQNVESEV